MIAEHQLIRHYTGFNFKNNDQLTLSLLLTPAACMYAISIDQGNEVYELGHMSFDEPGANDQEEQLQFFIRNFALDRRIFEKTRVTVQSDDFSLLPKSFYRETDQSEHLNLLKGGLQGKHIFSGTFKDVTVTYALEPSVRQLLEKTFSGIIIRHAGEVNPGLFFSHRAFAACQAALILGEKHCEIIFRDQERLLFYNSFKWNSTEDVLYYLLFAMEQFGLDPAHTRLAFGGEFELNKEPVITLKRYLFEVVPLVSSAPLKLHNHLDKLPGHFYFTLLNQHLCA